MIVQLKQNKIEQCHLVRLILEDRKINSYSFFASYFTPQPVQAEQCEQATSCVSDDKLSVLANVSMNSVIEVESQLFSFVVSPSPATPPTISTLFMTTNILAPSFMLISISVSFSLILSAPYWSFTSITIKTTSQKKQKFFHVFQALPLIQNVNSLIRLFKIRVFIFKVLLYWIQEPSKEESNLVLPTEEQPNTNMLQHWIIKPDYYYFAILQPISYFIYCLKTNIYSQNDLPFFCLLQLTKTYLKNRKLNKSSNSITKMAISISG